jgi:hypothetical protein
MLFGEVDFLLAGEQRNFAHLRQIHPDGVVRPRLRVVVEREQFVFKLNRRIRIGGRIDRIEINALVFQLHLGDGLSRKALLVVGRAYGVVVKFIQQFVVQGKCS